MTHPNVHILNLLFDKGCTLLFYNYCTLIIPCSIWDPLGKDMDWVQVLFVACLPTLQFTSDKLDTRHLPIPIPSKQLEAKLNKNVLISLQFSNL